MRKINPTCPVCSARSTKHGTTSKQRPRWRCTTCGHTFTRPNTNATEAARFKLFITWLTTSTTLTELAKQHHVSRRTLTRWFTTYWFITPPTSQNQRNLIARMKLIPVEALIRDFFKAFVGLGFDFAEVGVVVVL